MINIRNIITVARYELLTLYRSWFFRLFATIAILFLFGINMGMFVDHGGAQWSTRAIAANLPYINVLFINVAQAIIAVFLASDFLQRDKKLDTTEVIYARPISNGEYVVGKTLGILILFVGLVVVILAMTLVFNLISQDTPVVWQAYLYYPLLITVPTLIFILGFSFFLMILFRSQAVTFIVLLGYIGLTLFYFKDKLYGALDYMAFNLPMVYSDFIQFADPERIILQRLTYLFMGIGFIFATIRFLNRLPQTGRWNLINLVAFLGFLLLGGGLGYKYYAGYHQTNMQRAQYLKMNNQYAENLIVDVLSNDLYVIQDGSKLEVSSELKLRNQNAQKLDTLIFSLNPGFDIDSIVSGNKEVEFDRSDQLLFILPEEGLRPFERRNFTFYYGGKAEESVAYLDIRKTHMEALKHIQVATLDKKPGIIDDDFLLLTPELLWYPTAGVGFNLKTFLPAELDFVRFSMSVELDSNMTAIAPGAVSKKNGASHFEPETDLNAYSLVVGPFEKRTLEIEGVEYNLYLKPDHDYFSKFFPLISDSLDVMIKEAKDDYELDELDMYYPFKRINLVEVPIQYHAYERPYIQTIETVLPEMIFLPEKGAGLGSLDFSRYLKQFERQGREEDRQTSPREVEEELFKRFVIATFFRPENSMAGTGRNRRSGGDLITIQSESKYSKNPYNVFPLYYSYVTGISSREYSVFNSMLELYLKEGYEVSPRQGFAGGITSSERANLALQKRSMIEIFGNWDTELISSLISQAGGYIILALKNKVGMSDFDDFLYYYLEDHAFSEISFTKFCDDFSTEFGVEIEPYMEFINSGSEAASFLVSEPEFIQTQDEIGDVYLVKAKITNKGNARGLVDIVFRMPGQGGGGPGNMDTEERLYEVEAGETRDVQITLYDQPRMMTVNTMISANVPSTFNVFLRSAISSSTADQEEYDVLSDKPVSLVFENEFVVDNEDDGFSFVSVSNESKLKQYIDSRKPEDEDIHYRGISSWTPTVWTALAHSAFYGESVRSAYVCKKGDGQNIAKWETVLPEAGFYDVYMYVPLSAMYSTSSRGGRGGGGGGGGRDQRGRRGGGPQFADQGTKYPYVISSNEGSEELEFTLNRPEEGWNNMGTFHFPADTATVTLSNKTEGRRIFADAIKWVRRID